MLPSHQEPAKEMVDTFKANLQGCMETEEDGSLSMKLRLPDSSALEGFAKALATFAQLSGRS
jgi:hypothetical protein